MMRVALKGLLGRKLRATLTAFAIVLGVGMVSGSFVLTDTIQSSYDSAYDVSYKNADAVVSAKNAISSGTEGQPQSFSDTVLRRVRSLPEVAGTFASVGGPVGLVGRDGKTIGRGGSATSADPAGDQSLNQLELVRGAWPHGQGEIAIDKSTAEDKNYEIGSTIGAFGDGAVRQFRIAGIVEYKSSQLNGVAPAAVFDLATAQRLLDKQGKLDEIQVAARDGVSPAALTKAVRPLLPQNAQARTAQAQIDKASSDTASGLGSFRMILLAFGAIALFVGSFVIANTMSITVAQRMRELATLRTLGASRRQVLRSVVLEAVVVGLLASIAGLFLGIGLAQGLKSLLEAIGLGLPDGGIVLATRTVVVSLIVGTGIALLASLRPALRATRVEPIAAVREGATLPQSRLSRYGIVASLGVVAFAVLLLGYGVFAHGLATGVRMLALGIGSVLLFIGVALIAPRLVRPLVAVLGAPGARIAGAAGMLARDNARRNPSRTASTAAALMIGLALITFVAILGQGLRSSFVDAVDKQFIADYGVLSTGNPVTDKAARAVAKVPSVETVSQIRLGSARAFGQTIDVNGVDGNLTKVVDMTWQRGSDSVPASLGRHGAIVAEKYAKSHHLAVGSPLRLKSPTGQVVHLKVAGIFEEPKGGSPFGRIAMSIPTYDAAFSSHENEFVLVNIDGGPGSANTAKLNSALAAFPDADVQTRDEFKDTQIRGLKMLLNVVYALLGLSVVVSLFGIVNTLVLSVFERTRELGMLRAVGMTRRQVRRMIRHESIVTALVGATFGIAIGAFLAGLVTHAWSDAGFVFAVPVTTLVVFVAVAIVAGMAAAIMPARRAARLNVLEALQYE